MSILVTTTFACILAVTTPQGEICVKQDGTVSYPTGAKMDQLSDQFWKAIAQGWLKELFCDKTQMVAR